MLVLPGVVAADIYRSVQPDGSVIYSDESRVESEKIELQPVPVIPSNKPRKTTSSTPTVKPPKQKPVKPDLLILSPQQDQAIRSNPGSLVVSLRLHPRAVLSSSQGFVVILDKQQLPTLYKTLSFELENLPRGTHQLQVLLLDNKGTVVARSAEISFHLLRHSILFSP